MLASPINTPAEEAKCEDLERVIIGDDPERFFQVRSQLPPQEKEGLIGFIRNNVDVFAWVAYDAPGIYPNFICHHLNVNPSVTPKKQSPWRPSKEHADAIRDEVKKLKQAGAIKEVFYPKWLANTVVVKKKSGKWRVCVDFTDLNKACLKDPFPMSRIDQLVDAYDAPGIYPNFICHHLNVNPSVTPKKKSPWRPSKEHADAIRDEIKKLKQAGAIKEVFYPKWLANTVVVKKKSGKWRVCVDFIDLNKACPKDPFPMPRIDQLVDATVGHPQMSFLDAFQGYH